MNIWIAAIVFRERVSILLNITFRFVIAVIISDQYASLCTNNHTLSAMNSMSFQEKRSFFYSFAPYDTSFTATIFCLLILINVISIYFYYLTFICIVLWTSNNKFFRGSMNSFHSAEKHKSTKCSKLFQLAVSTLSLNLFLILM